MKDTVNAPKKSVSQLQASVPNAAKSCKPSRVAVAAPQTNRKAVAAVPRQSKPDRKVPGRNSGSQSGGESEEPSQPVLSTVLLGPGGPTAAGWHSIESFLRCAKEYQYAHVRKIRQPLVQTPNAFAVGSLFHAGRAAWFASNFRTDDATWKRIEAAQEHEAGLAELPVGMDSIRLARSYIAQYIDYWRVRPLPRPVAAEYLLGPAPLKPDDPFFLHRTARLDDVSAYPEAGMKLCIGESKTTSATVNDVINQYTLHGQTLLQPLLWRMAPQGLAMHGPIAGVLLDITVKGYGGKKCQFARAFMPVRDETIAWFCDSMRGYLRAAASVSWDSPAPRNVSMCTRMAGRGRIACEFRDLCMHGKSAAPKYVTIDGNSLSRWQPGKDETAYPWD